MHETDPPWSHLPGSHMVADARRFAKFGLVGALGALLNTALLYLLTRYAGLHYLVAATLSTEAAILNNFVLNDYWTFRQARARLPWLQRAARYNSIALGGLVISIGVLALLTHAFGLHYLIANLVAIGAATLWNYVVNSRFTWRVAIFGDGGARTLLQGGSGLLWRAGIALRPYIAAIAIMLVLGWIVLTTPGAWGTVAALFLGAALAIRPGVARYQTTVGLLAPVVGVSAVDYLTWRWHMINWGSWWVAVPLFVAEAFGALHTWGLHYTIWPHEEQPLARVEDPTTHPIFIFIPTVSEGPAILELTLRGAMAARERYLAAHPRGRVTIVVCNDGLVAGAANWQETEELARRMGAVCVTRTVKGGAKAGNIEHARRLLGVTGAALLVIFDADQIAEPDFLLKTIEPFADPTIGWVQTGQYYSNLDNPVARWANDQQALFYRLLCPGKARHNAAFICGTNVMLRAAALDEIGGLPQDSVTEDFAASIELHPRWRSVFLTDELAHGLGPMDLRSYFSQQRRWATGTLGVLRSHWRAIILPRRGGLRLPQRLQYALACTHYLCGVRDLIYIIAPLVFLATGIPAVRGATLPTFLYHFLPYWLASQFAFWHVARGKTSMRGIVIGFGSFPALLVSAVIAATGKRIGFAVTAKQRNSTSIWRPVLPHILALLVCFVVLVVGITTRRDAGPTMVSTIWVLYTMAMLGSIVWLAAANQAAMRSVAAHGARFAWWWRRKAAPLVWPALAVIAMLGVANFVIGAQRSTAQVQHFGPHLEAGHPYLGISLPVELLESRPAMLERRLGLSFAIVGRTQVIGDQFDRAWADQLAAHGERPWITLLFGVPGRSLLEASLPAIANGIHDGALRRWARSIRSYDKPVYLTILPHVDRNWSLSSAVANGGIPQDVPRVWKHVQSIFDEEGATNVAWAWAPADPAHDRIYAPPASTIDVIVLSLISYPNTTWADPARAITAVERRYPSEPLFVEVSAEGRSVRKARWLQSVGTAVAHVRDVYALLYHEGSPAVHATVAQDAAWSMADDPAVLRAVQIMASVDRVRTPTGIVAAGTTAGPRNTGKEQGVMQPAAGGSLPRPVRPQPNALQPRLLPVPTAATPCGVPNGVPVRKSSCGSPPVPPADTALVSVLRQMGVELRGLPCAWARSPVGWTDRRVKASTQCRGGN